MLDVAEEVRVFTQDQFGKTKPYDENSSQSRGS